MWFSIWDAERDLAATGWEKEPRGTWWRVVGNQLARLKLVKDSRGNYRPRIRYD